MTNILFIMCDQLRADYLSCYGHQSLHTPHLDRLAERGIRFERAYCQAPICGPSRMSFYTGRYMTSHGVHYNSIPLKVSEYSLGDYLRPLGMQTVLVGKTHMGSGIRNEMQRLGINLETELGVRLRECGFDPFERDEGLHPDPLVQPTLRYNQYLRELGYTAANPWHHNANSTVDEQGNVYDGWFMEHADKPANIAEEHSETPYMTGRAIDFIEGAGDTPWCLHLSYIKPHWPYIAPAPYHDMYTTADIQPPQRNEAERSSPHPVYQAYMQRRVSRVFSQDHVRERVIPVYMGLVKQIDDQVGRLMRFLADTNRLDDTVIVFTSDHGDYLGDHWLGEKSYFHDPAVRIPLIICDPSPEADTMRGMVSDKLVEAIDLVPTFIEIAGGEPQPHRLEGRSLLPLLHGDDPDDWREFAVSEVDYTALSVRNILDSPPARNRATMLCTHDWKYILHEGGAPQLFHLPDDLHELHDLGTHPAHAATRADLHERLFAWFRHRALRTTISDEAFMAKSKPGRIEANQGIYIGYYSKDDA